MYSPKNKNRLDKIYMQLLELSKGNFSSCIERTEQKDELEALTALINMTTEEIRDSFLHQGYVNFHDSYAFSIQMFFMLDEVYRIMEINQSSENFLGFEGDYLLDKPFKSLLSQESQNEWVALEKEITASSTQEKSLQLFFITHQDLLLPAFCRVIHFTNDSSLKGKTVVTTFDMVQTRRTLEEGKQKRIQNRLLLSEKAKRNKSVLQLSDIDKIRAAGEYIKTHLEEELPSLKDMALTFGTNEFKLKKGFKELYGKTVFQFLKEERLRKAHIIVDHSDKSFKEIAKMVGFKSATHFSREFKNRYGYRPRELRSAKKNL
ncbi:helix-turn-helix domain-containing protein [Tenacibaculum sp.]|uniref:helix-turn-helix domain-containing protein n=1 Tax=Tenacibaculum sp. TaxID=1906242 RepID=UPI003D12258B